MTIKKTQKVLLIIGVSLLVIQLPWYFAIQTLVNKNQTKTTATVISIIGEDAGCTGDKPGRLDPTCDHSNREYPLYEYFDESGQRHEQDDRFFGEYKKNNPLRKFFWKDIGETVTAYYTKDKPQEVVFMAGPLAYTAWLIPLYLATPVLIAFGVSFVFNKYKKH